MISIDRNFPPSSGRVILPMIFCVVCLIWTLPWSDLKPYPKFGEGLGVQDGLAAKDMAGHPLAAALTEKVLEGQLYLSSAAGGVISDLFEKGEAPLKDLLSAADIHYKIMYTEAVVRLEGRDGLSRSILLKFLIDEPGDGARLKLAFSGDFSSFEKKAVLEKLGASEPESSGSLKSARYDWRLLRNLGAAEWYFILVRILLGAALLLLLLWNLSRLSACWRLSAAALSTAALGLFFYATPLPSDIKLHFFNEHTQRYAVEIYGPGLDAFQSLLYRLCGMKLMALFEANRIMGLLTLLPFALFVRERSASNVAAALAAALLATHPLWIRYSSSDAVHPTAFFLFFSAAAMLSQARTSTLHPGAAFTALLALVLSMLFRAELMLLAPIMILILDWRMLKDWLRCLFSSPSRIAGVLFLTALPSFQVVFVLRDIGGGTPLLGFDPWQSLLTIFGHPGFNSFANPEWSPLPHRILVLVGFTGYFIGARKKLALGLLAASGLMLFNSFTQRADFLATHYQIAALPFYAMAAGGAAFLPAGPILQRVPHFKHLCRLAPAALTLLLFLGGPPTYAWLLKGAFTFEQEFKALLEHKSVLPHNCDLAYYRPKGDNALSNPYQIWFADEQERGNFIDIARRKLPGADSESQCLIFYKGPNCSMTRIFFDRPDLNPMESCLHFMKANPGGWTTLWEKEIEAWSFFSEEYIDRRIAIGFYRRQPLQ